MDKGEVRVTRRVTQTRIIQNINRISLDFISPYIYQVKE